MDNQIVREREITRDSHADTGDSHVWFFWDRRVNENAHTGMRMDGIDRDLCRDRRMDRDAIT